MLRNTSTGYGWVAILLHWTIGLIFIGQFALGLVMTEVTSQRTAFELIQLHKSFGFLLLGLVALRIGWRLTSVRPALPSGIGSLERRFAPVAHFALYLLQILVPLSGWALVSVSVLEIPSVPFNLFVMPNLPLGISDGAEAFWAEAHEILAYLAMGLVGLHVLAALRHHFWLRDAVLARMIAPFLGRSGMAGISAAPDTLMMQCRVWSQRPKRGADAMSLRSHIRLAMFLLLIGVSSTAQAVVLADAAGRYAIAPDASSIRFTISNLGGGGIKGAFARFKGGIRIDGRDIGRSHVDITIYPESVGTGQARMDAFLKSDAVFDTVNEREIQFRSTSVQRTGATAALITGRLTARGRTFPEKFQAELQSLKGGQIRFHVTGKVFRSRYGMDVGTPIYSNVVDFDMLLTARR